MKIALGADHAGFELKEIIRQHLANRGFELDDRGTNSPDSVDYPDFARLVGEQVASGKADLGILVCGAGIGISIAANKVTGIRAANAHGVGRKAARSTIGAQDRGSLAQRQLSFSQLMNP